MLSVDRPRRSISHRELMLVLALALSFPGIARAQDRVPLTDEQSARAEYQKGVEAAAQKRWEEAEQRFARVATFRAASPVLLALGRAQIENGKLATAKATLKRAAGDSDSAYGDVVAQARDMLRILEPRVPRIEVKTPPSVQGAVVSLDGSPVEEPARIEVDPDVEHRIAVRVAGKEPFEANVVLHEGEHETIDVVFPASPGEPLPSMHTEPAAPPTADEPTSGRRIIGPLIVGGAGVGAGVAGLVLRISGRSKYDKAEEQCIPSCPDQGMADRGNDARSTMLAGTIVASVGLAAIAGAGVWWALSGTDRSRSEGVRVGVVVGQEGPAAVVGGEF